MKSVTVIKYIAKGFVGLFFVPILSVWTVGSAICAVIALIGGVIGTFGFEGIGLNGFPGYELPYALSIPFGIGLSSLLFLSFYYTRRLLRECLHFMKF